MEFARLASVFDRMSATTKRLQLADELAALFADTPPSILRSVIYLCQGRLLPAHQGLELGMAEKMAIRSIALSTGVTPDAVEKHFRKTGDLGLTARDLMAKRTQTFLQQQPLTVEKVYDNFTKLATASGEGSQDHKIKLLSELLAHATPQEALVLTRFVLGNQRLGVGDATLIDALSVLAVGDKAVRTRLERAFNLRSDLGLVAHTLQTKGLTAVDDIKPQPFHPVRPALAERLPTPDEIIERLGAPLWVEAKYDGLRLQIHKQGPRVELYSRKQERVTSMFPDVVQAVRTHLQAHDAILEGEAIGYDEKTGAFLDFQQTIQRKRKHGIGEKTEEIPLKVFLFDLLYQDGKDWMKEPYDARHEHLPTLLTPGDTLLPSAARRVHTATELQAYFQECLAKGLEGIIAKDPRAEYTVGARKFAWVKLKKSYEEGLADTLDLVIVGYYRGKGKRTRFGFGGMLVAAYNPDDDVYQTVAKVGTGFSEEQMEQLRTTLEKQALKEKPENVDSLLTPDVWTTPTTVAVIKADEITRSPTHTLGMQKTSQGWKGEGLALRFPRLVGLRDDKNPRDATTKEEVYDLFDLQNRTKRAAPSRQQRQHTEEDE